jgi:hypothetical protein
MPTSKSKSPSEFEQQVAASSSSTQEFKLATPPSTGTGVSSAQATAVASQWSYFTSSQLSSIFASKSRSRSSQRRRPKRIEGDGKDSSSTSESKPSCTQKTTGPSRVYGSTEGDANERVNSFKFDFAVEPSNQTNNKQFSGFDVSLFESSDDVSNKASKRSRKKRKKKARKEYGKETADSASKVDSNTFAGTQNEMQQQTLEETGERSSHPIRNRSMGEATAPPLISLNISTQQQVDSASKNNPFRFDPVVKQRRAMVNRHSLELHHARQQRAMVIGSHKHNDQDNDSGVNPFTFGFSIFGNGLLPR